MQKGRPWYKWRKDLTRALQDKAMRDRYHWTPKQISDLKPEERLEVIACLEGEPEELKNG